MSKATQWLFGFHVMAGNARGEVRQGWHRAQFIGTQEEADGMAQQLRAEMTMTTPDQQIQVKADVLEPVGRGLAEHLEKLSVRLHQEELLGKFLAAQLALYVARYQMRLNANHQELAQKLLDEARTDLERLQRGEQVAAMGPQLVDASGRPAREAVRG